MSRALAHLGDVSIFDGRQQQRLLSNHGTLVFLLLLGAPTRCQTLQSAPPQTPLHANDERHNEHALATRDLRHQRRKELLLGLEYRVRHQS